MRGECYPVLTWQRCEGARVLTGEPLHLGCLRAWDSPGATLAQWQAGVPNRPQAPHCASDCGIPSSPAGCPCTGTFKLLLRSMPEVTVPLRNSKLKFEFRLGATTASLRL
jgi:hypothetical protein